MKNLRLKYVYRLADPIWPHLHMKYEHIYIRDHTALLLRVLFEIPGEGHGAIEWKSRTYCPQVYETTYFSYIL